MVKIINGGSKTKHGIKKTKTKVERSRRILKEITKDIVLLIYIIVPK